MATVANVSEAIEALRTVRQVRQYEPKAVPEDVLHDLLEVARWTGSARNSQPWHFIVITDQNQLKAISQIRAPIGWVADAPMAIAIVLNGDVEISEVYDEGRVTERILVAAHMSGLGGGVAWFGNDEQQAEGKRMLGIAPERLARSLVVLGYPITIKDPRPNPVEGGRKPLPEVVSYDRMGGSSARK